MSIKNLSVDEFKKLTNKLVKEQLALVKKVIREAEDPTTLNVDDVVERVQKTKTPEEEFERISKLDPMEQEQILRDLQRYDRYTTEGSENPADAELAQEMENFYQGWESSDYDALTNKLYDSLRQSRLAAMKSEKDTTAYKGKVEEPVKTSEADIDKEVSAALKTDKFGQTKSVQGAKPETKKDFGAWAKRHYKGIPGTVDDAQVLAWLVKNPTEVPLSPHELFTMYQDHVRLQQKLGTPGGEKKGDEKINKTLDKLDKVKASVEKKKGEYASEQNEMVAMEEIAAHLGITKEAVRKMLDRILAKAGDWVVGTKETGPSGKVYVDKEFDLTDGFMDALDEAARKYVTFLKKAVEIAQADGGDFSVEDFIEPFNEYVLKAAKLPPEEIKDAERMAIQYLADLIEEGNPDAAVEYLKKDLVKMGQAAEVVRTFSTFLARQLYPELRGRGRKNTDSED